MALIETHINCKIDISKVIQSGPTLLFMLDFARRCRHFDIQFLSCNLTVSVVTPATLRAWVVSIQISPTDETLHFRSAAALLVTPSSQFKGRYPLHDYKAGEPDIE